MALHTDLFSTRILPPYSRRRCDFQRFVVTCGPPNQSSGNSNRNAWGQEVNEEIFSIEKGWKVNPLTLASEEDLHSAGIEVPNRMKPRSTREKIAKTVQKNVTLPEKERLLHKQLRIIAGTQGGRKLLSPSDAAVRPMMEVVRGAVFSMIQAITGPFSTLPDRRWLDLYSGTGSVGIEALSRGCASAHFVELDPWVVSEVLSPNLLACGFSHRAAIHSTKVEALLAKALTGGAGFAGGPFDYISVTPPYEAVVYSELMAQLAKSPLVHSESCMIVEYPIKSKLEIPDTCGPLVKIRDRKYGRTYVALYGPQWASED